MVVVVCVRCIGTPQGKRKPYILLSAALACGGLLWLPHATDLPNLVASYLMLGIGNAYGAILSGLHLLRKWSHSLSPLRCRSQHGPAGLLFSHAG